MMRYIFIFSFLFVTLYVCGKSVEKSIEGTNESYHNPTTPDKGLVKHVVKPKDTVYNICQRFHVSRSELERLNPGLTNNIFVGQTINLPHGAVEDKSYFERRSHASKHLTVPQKQNGVRRHVVKKNETVYRIAKNYGVSVQALKDFNGGLSNNTIRVGQVLRIPPSSSGNSQSGTASVNTSSTGNGQPVNTAGQSAQSVNAQPGTSKGGNVTGNAQTGSASGQSAQSGNAQPGTSKSGNVTGNAQTGNTSGQSVQSGNAQPDTSKNVNATGNAQTGNTSGQSVQSGNAQVSASQSGNTQAGSVQANNAQPETNQESNESIESLLPDQITSSEEPLVESTPQPNENLKNKAPSQNNETQSPQVAEQKPKPQEQQQKPQQVKLSGKIVDNLNGETLLGANIYLKNDIQKGTTTNLDGVFNFPLDKRYENDSVVISYLGYEKQILPVKDLLAGGTIKMKPEGTMLQGVTVRGQRLVATEFTKMSIKKIDVYLNPSAKDDPILAVNSLPSSTTINETAEVNFRGSPSRETGIFLNDVPVYDAVKFEQDNNIGTFSIFSTDMVDQVLVFPSNPPLEYGNVSSGLIALTTQNQVDNNKVTLNAGVSQLGALVSQKMGDKASFTTQGRYQFSGLMKEINPVAFRDIRDFTSGDGSFNFYFEPNDKNRFKYYSYYDYEDYNIDINDPTLSADTRYSKTNFFQIGNYTHDNGKHVFRLNLSQGFNIKTFRFGNLDVKQTANNFYGSSSYTWYLPGSNTLKVGLDGEARTADLTGSVPKGSYDPEAPVDHVDTTINLNRLEAYVYGKTRLAKWLEFGAGLRTNFPLKDAELTYLSGQGNFKFNLTKNQDIKVGFGQYFRILNPTVIQFYRNEFRSRQASIDYQLKGSNYLVTLGVYYKYNTDLFNHDDYQIYGVEANYQQQLGKHITSDLNISQVNAEKINAPKFPTEFDLGFLLKHSLKVDLTHGFNFGTSLVFRQGAYYTPIVGGEKEDDYYLPIYADTNSARYPNYFKLDANLSKIISLKGGQMLIIYLVANNVTDTRSIDSYYYNRDFTMRNNKYYSRRSFYFGVQFQF